ncbi:MAG: hypothetical protein JW795_09035, partial [Chitinivibrionales bacterium]|nr:hypothetical protein [Chitinivibrionales bacterium]
YQGIGIYGQLYSYDPNSRGQGSEDLGKVYGIYKAVRMMLEIYEFQLTNEGQLSKELIQKYDLDWNEQSTFQLGYTAGHYEISLPELHAQYFSGEWAKSMGALASIFAFDLYKFMQGQAIDFAGKKTYPMTREEELGRPNQRSPHGPEVPQITTGINRSLDNPSSLKGATVNEVEALIPDGWVSGPQKKGEGTRYLNPNKPGEAIIIEKGHPNAKDPLHSGPYVRISRDGKIERIPLSGNPVLKK